MNRGCCGYRGRGAGLLRVVAIDERDDATLLVLAVPGLAREQVSVKLRGDQLVVTGRWPEGTVGNAEDLEISRRFVLEGDVAADDIRVEYEAGLLRVSISHGDAEELTVEEPANGE